MNVPPRLSQLLNFFSTQWFFGLQKKQALSRKPALFYSTTHTFNNSSLPLMPSPGKKNYAHRREENFQIEHDGLILYIIEIEQNHFLKIYFPPAGDLP